MMSISNDKLKEMIADAKSRYTWELNTAQINFRINIYNLLKFKGWSQKELADKMDVSQPWVSRHINDGSYPTLDSLAKYAHTFGVDIAELVAEPKTYPPYPIWGDYGEEIGSYTFSSTAVTITQEVSFAL